MSAHTKFQVHKKSLTYLPWPVYLKKIPRRIYGGEVSSPMRMPRKHPLNRLKNEKLQSKSPEIILISLAKNFFISTRTKSEIKKVRKRGCRPP